jgi:putative addiction module component (TIGR02574 family)
MSLTLQQFGIDQLDSNQRLELIGLIWDSLPDDAPFVPPAWHLELLEQRLAAADAAPDDVEPWETVRDRLLKRS